MRRLLPLLLVGCSSVGSSAEALSFQITVSGEELAVSGYDFTRSARANGDPPSFVDGWALEFSHVILTVADVRLNEDPDKNPNDATDVGPLVAEVKGPWAVDVHIGGALPGKSGSPIEKVVEIARIPKTTSGAAFDPTKRYAFGYDLARASAAAARVNLDAEGAALYDEAVAKGWAMVLTGNATYRGPAPMSSEHAKMPAQVKFKLGFSNPASYVNCRNTDLMEVMGDYPRGVQPSSSKATTVQITFHTDHLFWSALNVEGTPLHFDPIAAQSSNFGAGAPSGEVDIDALDQADFTAFKTKGGAALPWRSYVPDWQPPSSMSVSFSANGTTFTKSTSYASFLAYSAISGGHMNANGACTVRPRYPL